MKGQIDQPGMDAVILFCTSRTDLDRLGAAIKGGFEAPVIACTTSGEISTTGYTGSGLPGRVRPRRTCRSPGAYPPSASPGLT